MSVHYSYSLSSEPRTIVQQTIRSLRSLLSSTSPDPKQVHLFITPPVYDEDVNRFEDLGVTVHVEDPDFPHGFRTRLGDPLGEYAEKWKLTKIDADTVVFLDCDTVVMNDLKDVVKGDFDLKARPLEANDAKRWQAVFERYDEPYRSWYPNTGFLIFKNRYHKQIQDKWAEYIQTEIPYYVEGYTKEQFALALASTNCDFTRMNDQEHVMEWLDEVRADGYVHHLANQNVSVVQELLNALDGSLPPQIQDLMKGKLKSYYDAI